MESMRAKISGAEQTSGCYAKELDVTVMIDRLQLEDGLATRSAQHAAKRFGCCHHGAILRVGEGPNLGRETATATDGPR